MCHPEPASSPIYVRGTWISRVVRRQCHWLPGRGLGAADSVYTTQPIQRPEDASGCSSAASTVRPPSLLPGRLRGVSGVLEPAVLYADGSSVWGRAAPACPWHAGRCAPEAAPVIAVSGHDTSPVKRVVATELVVAAMVALPSSVQLPQRPARSKRDGADTDSQREDTSLGTAGPTGWLRSLSAACMIAREWRRRDCAAEQTALLGILRRAARHTAELHAEPRRHLWPACCRDLLLTLPRLKAGDAQATLAAPRYVSA